jgi:hypothetical protein
MFLMARLVGLSAMLSKMSIALQDYLIVMVILPPKWVFGFTEPLH